MIEDIALFLALAISKQLAKPEQKTVPIPAKSARPDGLGFCSELCTCGCNAGLPCKCGQPQASVRPIRILVEHQPSLITRAC